MKEAIKKNSATWDEYYKTYQRESVMPGVRYPNEHLVRFLMRARRDEKPGKDAVELGFGTIANMEMMADLGYSVRGLEVSQDAVRRAEKAIGKAGLGARLSVGLYEGNTIPLADESADVIVGLQCVYYNLDQELFARECDRVLRPGGKVFFSFFTPRHGYMDYIEGKPGGIVKFGKGHPNPRLEGLELFLYESREQFDGTYGKYFDIEIGLDEFDLYPVFMSWYYLAGVKKGGSCTFDGFVSTPPAETQDNDTGNKDIDVTFSFRSNLSLWESKYESIYKEAVFPGNRYPNEYLTRYLATRNRGGRRKFYTHIGTEDNTGTGGLRALEIMPLNITNLKMAREFLYEAHGVTFSEVVFKGANRIAEKEKVSVKIDKMRDGVFPYEGGSFEIIFSEKAGTYFTDQKAFVDEIGRITSKDGEILIGYLSPRHGYMKWASCIGGGYYRIGKGHPDQTMRSMTLFMPGKERLLGLWKTHFDCDIKSVEFDTHRYFSSFHLLNGRKR